MVLLKENLGWISEYNLNKSNQTLLDYDIVIRESNVSCFDGQVNFVQIIFSHLRFNHKSCIHSIQLEFIKCTDLSSDSNQIDLFTSTEKRFLDLIISKELISTSFSAFELV